MATERLSGTDGDEPALRAHLERDHGIGWIALVPTLDKLVEVHLGSHGEAPAVTRRVNVVYTRDLGPVVTGASAWHEVPGHEHPEHLPSWRLTGGC